MKTGSEKQGHTQEQSALHCAATGDMDLAIAIRTMILKIKKNFMCRLGEDLSTRLYRPKQYQKPLTKAKSMTKLEN